MRVCLHRRLSGDGIADGRRPPPLHHRRPGDLRLLCVGVLLGEMLPMKIPRRGDDEALTLSTSFAMALLLVGGLGPGADRAGRRLGHPGRHLGQAVVARALQPRPVRALDGRRLSSCGPSRSRRAWTSSTRSPAASCRDARSAPAPSSSSTPGSSAPPSRCYQHVPVLRYFRNNLFFVVVTGGVMLLVSPLVLAAAAYSVALVPLCLAPIVAIYNSVSQSARTSTPRATTRSPACPTGPRSTRR